MNFLLALFGGMMTAYLVSGGNAFWTFSGGLTGLISASAVTICTILPSPSRLLPSAL